MHGSLTPGSEIKQKKHKSEQTWWKSSRLQRVSIHKCPAIQDKHPWRNVTPRKYISYHTRMVAKKRLAWHTHNIFLLAWSTWSFFFLNSCQRMPHYAIISAGEHKWVAFAERMQFNFAASDSECALLDCAMLKCTSATVLR